MDLLVREHWKEGDVLMCHVDAKVFDDAPVEVHYVPAVSFNSWRYGSSGICGG